MKKTLSLTLALVLSLALLSTALAVTEGDYTWEGHAITLISVDAKPMFAPANMTGDQHAIAIHLNVPAAVMEDEALRNMLYEQAKLVDENGTAYAPGSAMSKATEYTLLFAVDNGVEPDALTLQLSPASAASPGLLSAEENKVVLVIQNVYVDLGRTGINAVYYAEETDPENDFYSSWDDWFMNASYSSASVRQGTQVNISFVEGAFVTEVADDGVVDVVFLVDGKPFEIEMRVGAKLTAIKTADGEYYLLAE